MAPSTEEVFIAAINLIKLETILGHVQSIIRLDETLRELVQREAGHDCEQAKELTEIVQFHTAKLAAYSAVHPAILSDYIGMMNKYHADTEELRDFKIKMEREGGLNAPRDQSSDD